MLLTVYKSKEEVKTFNLPDDEDLTEFREWASENNIWYTISKTEINNGRDDNSINTSNN